MTEASFERREEAAARRGERRVFSARLNAFLDQLYEGQTPNAGSFCSFCYNPLPPGYERCDHCGQAVTERPPIQTLPGEVLEMHRRMRKRESVIVNAMAYLGLALGLALFLGMVAINVLYMDRALWFFVLATAVFLVGSRLLAGLLGGILGDEIAYRYANKRLAEDWAAHVARRETRRTE
ncbi:MAG TPA: hypothetical protein VNN21_05405 [Dehalococcoidia bacterium]|nr:hypothetical protein [Dehalococcoidia bacterium]